MPTLLSAAADTLLVRQVPPVRSGFEETVFVAAGLAQIVTLVVVVLLAIIFFRMWKAQQAIQEQLNRLASQVDPMIRSATAAADNVRDLTDTVRHDASAAAEALATATARVRDSVTGIADRIDDFGALLGRVTSKAEAVADVASAAAGTIQAGKRLWDSRREQRQRPDEEREEPRRLAEDEDDLRESPYAEDSPAPPRVGRRKRRHRRRGGSGGGPNGNADAAPPQ